MLITLAIQNYRSLLKLVMPLRKLNVITGPNGSGKSNLYRALRLLAETAQGGITRALAREGGLPSTLWAGPEKISVGMRKGVVPVQGLQRKEAVRLRLGYSSQELEKSSAGGAFMIISERTAMLRRVSPSWERGRQCCITMDATWPRRGKQFARFRV